MEKSISYPERARLRLSRTPEFYRSFVRDYPQSGLSIPENFRRHNVGESTFRKYRLAHSPAGKRAPSAPQVLPRMVRVLPATPSPPSRPFCSGGANVALARYSEAARAHNALLEAFLLQKEQLDWLKRQQYGARSEKFIPTPEKQQALFAPRSMPENGGFAVTVEPILDPGRALKTHRRTIAPKGHGWGVLPDHLEREDIPVPLTDEQKARLGEGMLVKIRDEVTERLAVRPRTLFVKRFIRPVFGAVEKDGTRSVIAPPVPELPIETKSRADLSLLIHLTVAKFLDHLPLDRIRTSFLRQGVRLQTSTLCTWMATFHDLLLPVYLAMADAVKKESLIHTDDTVVRVIRGDKKHKTHKGRMWVYIGGGHFVYEYTPTRAGANPSRFLAGFKGTIQADGYAGYNEVAERSSVARAGCHSHARRYFEKALPYFPEAEEMLLFYRSLFEIERKLTERGATPAERLDARQELSRPLLSNIPHSGSRDREIWIYGSPLKSMLWFSGR